ncbi:C2 domain-containing protein 2 [Elsinoe australis]|uniref:C2 domain-containing protein 2 n=1 Tax=Elsinoe australis TaxID=40998 RepID=A0A4U7AZE1_9PEZI|nr:C2 domain-containing protein 2 [Elsinoe australis]
MLEGVHGDRASELKQQGALEASRDPHSSVSADDAEKKVLNEAKAAGAAAFQFDPNASSEDKARQAKAHVPQELQNIRKHKVAALVSDQDDGQTAGYDLPPPSKAGAIDVPSSPTEGAANGKIEKDEDWKKVAWAPRFGNPADKEEDEGTLLDHQTMLEGKLDEKFFGDWYHNTGIIIFACLSTYVVAILGGGLASVTLITVVCGTYYRTSIRRVRRNFRDDVHRQLAKQKLETDNESLEWMNSFLTKFWPIYAPVLCATIVNSVDQVLSTSTPAFLDSMRMKFFTLGTKPPRLEHVKTYPKAEDDIVLMDWKFSFTPNDVADLTARQIKNKVNPKVVLEVRVGKAMISKGLDVIVEDMAFSGLMRVKMKLQIPFPHIEKVEICFLGRPTIDYVCKPLGGDTFGFDINFIPGLETFIMEMIHANLEPMMYEPNVFPIEIAKMLAGNPVDQAVGVLQVTFHGAQGLKNTDKFSGTPDPYAVVAINGREPLGKTKTVHENASPRWNETVNVILTSLKDNLTITVFDYNEFRKDKELGQATFALSQLETDHEHENQQLEIIASGRPRGIVQADIRFFPVLEGHKLPDGTQESPPESNTGIAKFTVESAKELDGSKSMIGQLNPYAVLLLNGKEVHISQKLKRTNNPIWPDATKDLLITDRKKAKLGLVIKDDRDLAADPIIGTYQIKLTDMLDLMEKGQEWYSLAGVQSGRAKMTLQWKPVALSGALGGTGGYITPIGVMRIHLKSAKQLRNLETMGKSDPYARIMLSGIQKGRTVTFKNNLDPDWDEVIYVPVHSNREKLVVEVMDEENLGKDRSLGSVEIATADYVEQSRETGEYETHDSKRVLASQLSQGPRSPPKGTLNYTVSFFPAVPVIDPDEEEREAARSSVDTSRQSLEPSRTSVDTDTKKSLDTGRARSGTVGTISSLKTSSTTNGTNPEAEMRKKLAEGEKHQGELDELPGTKEVPKIRLTAQDLGDYESGLLVFKLIDGDMAHSGCHLEVIMDDNLFPAYSSAKTRSKQYSFNETGDCMVRELDLSKITLRLVEEVDKKGEGDTEHIKAKLTGDTLSVLRQALYTPTQLTLKDKSGRESKITVSLKFIPVKMKLDPAESVNNQGNLRVEVLDAADLPAADRNGYSDPFCKFVLDGKEIFKSQVQKKTLHPAWNEFFEVPIRSRTASDFEVSVFDWDFGGKDDFLGKATINLDVLEPFRKQEVKLQLDGTSGVIRLGMLFKPDYVTRSRQGSSTFSGTFATPGKIVGAPVKGVGKAGAFVGGNVIKGATFLGRSFRGKKDRTSTDEASVPAVAVNGDTSPVNEHERPIDGSPQLNTNGLNSSAAEYANKDLPATPSNRRSRSIGTAGGSPLIGPDTGTAHISIVSASGYPAGTKVQVSVLHDSNKGLKEVLKTKPIKTKTGDVNWEEEKHPATTKVSTTADAQFRLAVYDHSTFGGSDDLGEAAFFIDDQGSGGEKSVRVGGGQVLVRSSFEPAPPGTADGKGADAASFVSGGTSPGGKALRKSFIGRRERSVTPGQQ